MREPRVAGHHWIPQPTGPDCKTCKVGHWVNAWWRVVGSYFHKHHYRWWFWWVNRPNSASRKRLEKIFPNLRKDT